MELSTNKPKLSADMNQPLVLITMGLGILCGVSSLYVLLSLMRYVDVLTPIISILYVPLNYIRYIGYALVASGLWQLHPRISNNPTSAQLINVARVAIGFVTAYLVADAMLGVFIPRPLYLIFLAGFVVGFIALHMGVESLLRRERNVPLLLITSGCFVWNAIPYNIEGWGAYSEILMKLLAFIPPIFLNHILTSLSFAVSLGVIIVALLLPLVQQTSTSGNAPRAGRGHIEEKVGDSEDLNAALSDLLKKKK